MLPFRLEDLAGDFRFEAAVEGSSADVLEPGPGGSDDGDGDLEDEVDDRDPGVGGRRSGSRRCGEEEDVVLLTFDGKTLADVFSLAKLIVGED